MALIAGAIPEGLSPAQLWRDVLVPGLADYKRVSSSHAVRLAALKATNGRIRGYKFKVERLSADLPKPVSPLAVAVPKTTPAVVQPALAPTIVQVVDESVVESVEEPVVEEPVVAPSHPLAALFRQSWEVLLEGADEHTLVTDDTSPKPAVVEETIPEPESEPVAAPMPATSSRYLDEFVLPTHSFEPLPSMDLSREERIAMTADQMRRGVFDNAANKVRLDAMFATGQLVDMPVSDEPDVE